jgi:hypothetical protein
MKFLKTLILFTMALGLCFTAAACGGDTDETSNTQSSVEQTTEGYTFIVLNADGTPAQGVNVQLCVLGNAAACYMPIATDASGKVIYNPMGFPGAGEYEIHLFDLNMSALEFTGPVSTPTVYGEITLTLK